MLEFHHLHPSLGRKCFKDLFKLCQQAPKWQCKKKKSADTPQNKLLKISGKVASLKLLSGCNLLQSPTVIKRKRHFRTALR